MPRTALKTVSSNLPTTPGRQVKYLSEELGKKETENNELKSSIFDLTKALDSLAIVKEKVESNNPFEKAAAEAKKSKKRDIDAPAAAVTAYIYFREANKDKVTETEDEKVNWRELWKECKGDERQKFVDMAAVDKERFDKVNEPYQIKLAAKGVEDKALEMYYEKQKQEIAMEFYEAHINAKIALDEKNKSKKKVKDPDAPKRPLSNYMYFTQDKRAEIVKNNPNASVTDVSKILGEEWSKLNKGKGGKKGTKKFDESAAKDKARYDVEKEAYDAVKATRKLTLEQEREEQLQQDKEEAMKLMNEIREEQEKAAEAEAMEAVELAAQDEKKEKKLGPKKARSAYIFFSVQKRAEIKAGMPETATNQELMAEIGRQWKTLSDAHKIPYEKSSCEDKERYVAEAEAMFGVAPAPQDKKKKERKPGPKKACSAYLYFTVQNRAQIKAVMPETATNQELMAEIGRQWKTQADAQKKPYEELAAKDKQRYEKEAIAMKKANP